MGLIMDLVSTVPGDLKSVSTTFLMPISFDNKKNKMANPYVQLWTESNKNEYPKTHYIFGSTEKICICYICEIYSSTIFF